MIALDFEVLNTLFGTAWEAWSMEYRLGGNVLNRLIDQKKDRDKAV